VSRFGEADRLRLLGDKGFTSFASATGGARSANSARSTWRSLSQRRGHRRAPGPPAPQPGGGQFPYY